MESLNVFRSLGEQHSGIPWVYQDLGACALAQGHLVGAQGWFAAGLVQFRNQSSREGMAICLSELKSIMGLSGRPVRATRLWGASEAVRQAIGWGSAPPADATYEQAMTTVRAYLGEEAFTAEWATGHLLTPEQAISEALDGIEVESYDAAGCYSAIGHALVRKHRPNACS